jgi:hypothetical protein
MNSSITLLKGNTTNTYWSYCANGTNKKTTEIDTHKTAQPAFSFEDTGLLNNDGITNNGVITINNLEVNATWQYSISGDNGFVDGTHYHH